MDYGELCKMIKVQIDYYHHDSGRKPNNIILGKEIFSFLNARCKDMFSRWDVNAERTIYGLPITVDFDNEKVIKVGYMETVNY